MIWSVAGGLLWAGMSILNPHAVWGLGWWALVSGMLLSHLGMVEGEDGSRRENLGTPNALTLSRAWAVPAVALLVGVPWAFATLLAAAAVTDVLDGHLARAGGQTRLGAHMDHGVDTALTITAAIGAAAAGWMPWWLAWIVAARYAGPIIGLAAIYFATARQPLREAFVRGRIPGGLVLLGLALVTVDQTRLAGGALIAAGAMLGVVALVTSAARSVRVAR
ncbi:MAG: CDP-alcohol phosphatidyltransferase family protein [Thermoleophilia bacterium]|nr:CDP-alcohol phosphatidyltransferase family protein [Thermoleophilia bacterium]MDH3724214.1 CDP-alcohol phosphatidyltransferase family protein [Thermoleophilia bacterium]